MKDFRRFCNQTQHFVYNLGHPNAFGSMISDTNLNNLLTEYKNVNLSDCGITYDVDNLYLNDVPSKKDIVAFDDNRDLFGGIVKDPQLGFVGLHVKRSNIKFYGSVFIMKSHGLKFILFNISNVIKNKITNHHGDFYFDVIGTPDINRFMKFCYPQIIINNLKIVKSIKRNSYNLKAFADFYF